MTTKRIPNKQNTCDICECRHYHKDCKPIEKQQKIHDDRHYYEFEREDKKYRTEDQQEIIAEYERNERRYKRYSKRVHDYMYRNTWWD